MAESSDMDRSTSKSADQSNGNVGEDKTAETAPRVVNYQTAGEYADAVNCWLQQCYYWNFMAANFPYFAMQQMFFQQQRLQLAPTGSGMGWRTTAGADSPPPPPVTYIDHVRAFILRRVNHVRLAQRFGNLPANPALFRLAELRGREFRIPSVWKRFSAELVDFAILFLMKLFITFIAMDFFDMIDLDKYDDAYFKEGFHYSFALQITSDIFILELIHRVVVCLFEALCLHQGTNGAGGATPGKSLLGLRVVTCETIQQLQGDKVLVYPAGDIGLGWGLLRSVIKNFTMALLFPACITMFFFPFQRTVYDILCGCLVVEDIRPVPFPR